MEGDWCLRYQVLWLQIRVWLLGKLRHKTLDSNNNDNNNNNDDNNNTNNNTNNNKK